VTSQHDREPHGKLDALQLAVFTSRFEAIVRTMVNTLVRTGRSGVLNTARDFSCCILTASDELLVMAESVPIHVMSSDLMTRAMKELQPDPKRGDAFLHNSPYHGCTHAADHTILIPVLDDEGTHRFTVFAKAHQADCGNSVPTTYFAAARDVYEEGALLFPCVKVQEDYRDCEDIVRMCKMRIRVPEQWWGDYLALLGAARIGERRLIELANETDWDLLDRYARDWFAYSEQRMDAAVGRLATGRVTVHTAHDPFPGVPNGIPVKVEVAVDADRGTIEVDLRDNPDCQPCGLNLSQATATAAAATGVFNSIDHVVPPNAGSMRRLRIHLRENCVVGIPRHPTSCSVATTNLSDRVANAVQRAMAELGDSAGMAETGLSQPPSLAVISGRDPRQDGAPFVNQLILPALTGGAGTPTADGWLMLANTVSAGVMFRDSVEIDELQHPMRIEAQSIIPDSEGAGQFRGAPGSFVEYGPVGCSMEAMYVSDGTTHPALGTRGGLAGARARQLKRERDSGRLVELDACGHVLLEDGDTILSYSCGGGGYGPPLAREPIRVAEDVAEGWISRSRAAEAYGVILDEVGGIDAVGTETLRASRLGPADAPPTPEEG
jgi:N-methylhydantoinase B